MNAEKIAIAKGLENEDLQDVLIMEKIKKGDLNSFGELYNKHYKTVYYKLLGMFKNKEKAEDLASDVMLKIKDNAESFNVDKGSGKVSGWITTVAHNAFLDLKRKQHDRLELDNEQSHFELLEDGLNPENQMIMKETLMIKNTKFQEAISQLSEIEQKIVMLRCYHELSYEDIAEKLNMDENYCRVKFHRLKNKMRKKIKK
jgi:RNA polymerase sigma-70 factor (ECF subfamily)